jgi:hypothetical protein
VPLTSVRQPKYQLGQAAAELLLDEADRPDEHEHRRIVFKPELVARASSRSAINEEAVNEEAVNEEAVNEKAVNEEAVREEAVSPGQEVLA